MDEMKTRQERREELQPRRRSRRKSIGALIAQDLMLIDLILFSFALAHHGFAYMRSQAQMAAERRNSPGAEATAEPAARPSPAPTQATPAPAGTEQPGPDTSPEPTPEPTPDPMDWRTKFAEHFTDEVVITDNSYTSPNIAIEIQKLVTDDPAPSTVYVADIYIAQLENLQTYWAGGSYRTWAAEDPVPIARSAGAILAVNGDYADSQYSGFLVRNGELYMDEQTVYDICVLYYDGTMETYGAKDYTVEEVLERQPYQVWKFGPRLLDENGQPCESFNATSAIADVNPRTGIGYYEPGHYCFVVVDGRQNGYSAGMRIGRFAQLFADLGCVAAYNLDGGQSSVMTFRQSIFNHPYLGGRGAGDIVLIREIEDEEG